MSLATAQNAIVRHLKIHRRAKFNNRKVLAEHPVGSGKFFSCSTDSQDNWGKLASLDSRGLVSYPFVVTTHDERSGVSLANSAELTAAITAIGTAVLTERALCAAFITDVLAAGDEAAAHAAAAPYLVWT